MGISKEKTRIWTLCLLVAISCGIMGVVDAIIQPGYLIKSIIKIVLFLAVPIAFAVVTKKSDLKKLFIFNKKGFLKSILLGLAIFTIIILGYFLLKDVFDFSSITDSLMSNVGVSKENFVFVAIYISLANSLLEEFFFRGFTFFELRKLTNRTFAYIFSSLAFALYHVSMMFGWFSIWLMLLAILGLFVGGMIFNALNEKHKNIYTSWTVHMFANFAINTIGFILFGII